MGVAIATKIMDPTTKFIIWDIAGFEQEKHYKPYLRGAHGIIYVVDATEPASISALDQIIADAPELNAIPSVCFINKADLSDDIQWQTAYDDSLNKLSTDQFWTSAKTGDNVETGFEKLSHLLQ